MLRKLIKCSLRLKGCCVLVGVFIVISGICLIISLPKTQHSPAETMDVMKGSTSDVIQIGGASRRSATTSRSSNEFRDLVLELSLAVRAKDSDVLNETVAKIRNDLPSAVPELITLLNQGDRDAREIAAQLLAENGSKQAVAALLAEYKRTEDDNFRSNLQHTILSIRSEESVAEFVQHLDRKTPGGVRRLSELVLAEQGSPIVVVQLNLLYDSTNDVYVRRSIATVMRNIHNSAAVPVLRQLIETKNQPREKLEMYVDALISIKTEQAENVVRVLAADADKIRSAIGREAILEFDLKN